MKILCVARNYIDHVKELNNAIPENPVVFMKPQNALLNPNEPFYHPEFSKHIDYETEIVLKMGKNGRKVSEKHALSYIEAVTVGIDWTARDLQTEQKLKGLPWEIAKSFDDSACVGEWIPVSEIPDLKNIEFHLDRNGETVQRGNTSALTYDFIKIITYVSQFFTLNVGDMIFTGTPFGVGKIAVGEKYEGFMNGKKLFGCEIK